MRARGEEVEVVAEQDAVEVGARNRIVSVNNNRVLNPLVAPERVFARIYSRFSRDDLDFLLFSQELKLCV